LLTRMFTATRRFCALPSGVSLLAAGSASAIPVGVSSDRASSRRPAADN
jgi:hypothetical protein